MTSSPTWNHSLVVPLDDRRHAGRRAISGVLSGYCAGLRHDTSFGYGRSQAGGRFNRPRQEALYLSADEITALAEYKQDNPWLQPGTICTFFAKELRVADLSAGFDPENWSDLWADFAIDWRTERFGNGIEPPTWYMADDVVAAGLDGILFPSQARPGGTNLVIYRSSQLTETQLCIYDPASSLKGILAGA